MVKFRSYFNSLALVGLVSLVGEFVHGYFEPTNLVMLYLLAVVISASFWGRGPAIFTSVSGVLIFDFLFVPPRFTLSVDDAQYLVTFIGLFIVGLVISELMLKMRQRAIESNRRQVQEKLQSAILNSVSHDLRTPLVTITGVLSNIINNKILDGASRDELVKTAFSESIRLNRIVENLLDMTRIESKALQLSLRDCGIKDIVGVSLEQLKAGLESRNICIDIPEGLPEIKVDFVLMVKVLTNIIDNASKYSKAGLPIYISANNLKGIIQIIIADRGLGIPEKDLLNVFNKFYRIERIEQIPGTGLGLSICKGIVEAHGGKIWLENAENGGLRAVIELPLENR